jgi:hypothetical protein
MTGGTLALTLVAGAAIAVVIGVLGTLPVWTRAHGRRLVAILLTAQGGGVFVVGAITSGAAVRTWQLVDRPANAHIAPTLITLSRIDGDAHMYALLLLATVAATALTVLLLFVSARFAVTEEPADRWIACTVLGLEIGLCGYGLAAFLTGSRSVPAVLSVINLPLAMAAMVACWPPRPLDAS